MSEKCFCHFNGYEVKDAAARKAAEEGRTATRFFFPSLESGGSQGNSAIITTGGKCVLMDCCSEVNYDAIRGYYTKLHNEGAFSNIDYIVISHYHYDHVENLEALLDLFPHDGCVAFLPMNPEGYYTGSDAANILETRNTTIDVLNRKNVEYVEVDSVTNIDIVPDICSIELFNSSAADYSHYSGKSSPYNDYSLCALIKTGEVYSLFPGDIQTNAQQRIYETRTLPRLFLYAVHHHGLQNDDYVEYLDMISPENSVIQINHEKMNTGANNVMAVVRTEGNAFSTGYGDCEFVIRGASGSVVKGWKIPNVGWWNSNFYFYVDNEYTGTKHTGSEAQPFTDINEAIAAMNNNRAANYIVYVKATETPYPVLYVRNLQRHVDFRAHGENTLGKPMVQGLSATAAQSCDFENIAFIGKGSSNRTVYISSSNVKMTGCIVEQTNDIAFANKLIYMGKSGYLYIADSEIRHGYYGIAGEDHSTVITKNLTFSDISNAAIQVKTMNFTLAGEDTLADDVPVYIMGHGGEGSQITVTTRTSTSNLINLVGKNSNSVLSYPFCYNNVLVVMLGKKLYTVPTTEFSAG